MGVVQITRLRTRVCRKIAPLGYLDGLATKCQLHRRRVRRAVRAPESRDRNQAAVRRHEPTPESSEPHRRRLQPDDDRTRTAAEPAVAEPASAIPAARSSTPTTAGNAWDVRGDLLFGTKYCNGTSGAFWFAQRLSSDVPPRPRRAAEPSARPFDIESEAAWVRPRLLLPVARESGCVERALLPSGKPAIGVFMKPAAGLGPLREEQPPPLRGAGRFLLRQESGAGFSEKGEVVNRMAVRTRSGARTRALPVGVFIVVLAALERCLRRSCGEQGRRSRPTEGASIRV